MESEPAPRRLARVLGLVALAVGLALAGCGPLDSPVTTLRRGPTSADLAPHLSPDLRWDRPSSSSSGPLWSPSSDSERDPAAVPPAKSGAARCSRSSDLCPSGHPTIAFLTVGRSLDSARRRRTLREGDRAPVVVGVQYPELGVVTATLPPPRRPAGESRDGQHRRDSQLLGAAAWRQARRDPWKHDAHRPDPRHAGRVLRPMRRVLWGVAREHAPPGGRGDARGLHGLGRGAAEPAAPARRPPAAAGLRIYLTARASPSHGARRLGGGIGPDLTHFGSRKTIAGGIPLNTLRTSRAGCGTRRR